jgi:hypothetical protein
MSDSDTDIDIDIDTTSTSTSTNPITRFNLIHTSSNQLNRRRTIFYPSQVPRSLDVNHQPQVPRSLDVNHQPQSLRSLGVNHQPQAPRNLGVNHQPQSPLHNVTPSIYQSQLPTSLQPQSVSHREHIISQRTRNRLRIQNMELSNDNIINNPYNDYINLSGNNNTENNNIGNENIGNENIGNVNLNNNEPSFSLVEDQPIPNNSADEAFELDGQGTLSDQVINKTVDDIFDKKCNLLNGCLNLSQVNNEEQNNNIFTDLHTKMHQNIEEFIRSLNSNHEIQEIDKEMFEIHKTCDFEDNSEIDLVQLKKKVNNKITEELGMEVKELSNNIKKWKQMLKTNLNGFFDYETKLKNKLRKLHKLHMWIQSAKEFGVKPEDCQKIVLENLEKANIMEVRKEILETKLLFQSLMELNKQVHGVTENKFMCSICFDNICDKLIIPCGHLICSQCYEKLRTTNHRRMYNQLKCHLCRGLINRVQKIYFS